MERMNGQRILVERPAMGGVGAAYPGEPARRETAAQSGNYQWYHAYFEGRLALA